MAARRGTCNKAQPYKIPGHRCAGGEACTLLHIATISGALACLMRHFRASLASLPLLAQPISALPVGTWSPDSPHAQAEPAANGAPQARTLWALAGSQGGARVRTAGLEVHGSGHPEDGSA